MRAGRLALPHIGIVNIGHCDRADSERRAAILRVYLLLGLVVLRHQRLFQI